MKFYSPPVDLDIIAKVKKAVKIPVFGNGGVFSAKDALEMFDRTGCDGIMIAQGALGNPWIFEEIRAALSEYADYVAAQTLSLSLEQQPLAGAPAAAAEVEWGDGAIRILVCKHTSSNL